MVARDEPAGIRLGESDPAQQQRGNYQVDVAGWQRLGMVEVHRHAVADYAQLNAVVEQVAVPKPTVVMHSVGERRELIENELVSPRGDAGQVAALAERRQVLAPQAAAPASTDQQQRLGGADPPDRA